MTNSQRLLQPCHEGKQQEGVGPVHLQLPFTSCFQVSNSTDPKETLKITAMQCIELLLQRSPQAQL